MNQQPDKQQEIYGDIPADRPELSPKYTRAVLPKAVQEKLAERETDGRKEKKTVEKSAV